MSGLSSLVGSGLIGLGTEFLAQQSDRKTAEAQAQIQAQVAYAQIQSQERMIQKGVLVLAVLAGAYFLFGRKGRK